MFIYLHQPTVTPLHVAACRDNVETVAFLVDKGVDVNIEGEVGVSTSIDIIDWKCVKDECGVSE